MAKMKDNSQLSFADIDDLKELPGRQAETSVKKNPATPGEIQPGRKAPYNQGSDTSLAAARSVETPAGRMRMLVLAYVAERGPAGAVCDEAEVALGMSHQTCSARMNELCGDHMIEDSGRRRATRSGRNAAIMVVTELGLNQLPRSGGK